MSTERARPVRPRPVIRRPRTVPSGSRLGGLNAEVLQLQSAVGNRQVSRLIGAVQRVTSGPGFDPKAVRNVLIRAIDTTPLLIAPTQNYLPRNVNVDKIVAVLTELTADQVAQVQQSYWDHEGRKLDDDLFGASKGGTNLSVGDRARIRALLKGTAAESAENVAAPPGVEGPAAAALSQAAAGRAAEAASARDEAASAELFALLTDKPNERERERIMVLLRNDPVRNGAIAGHYKRLFNHDLYADIRSDLDDAAATRAEKLVIGDRVAADAVAVAERQAAIAKLNERIATEAAAIEHLDQMGASADIAEVVRAKLEESRREQVTALQAVLERSRAEAMAMAEPGTAAAAGAQRVGEILHQPGAGGSVGEAVARVLHSDEQATVSALGANSPPDLAAARLYQAVGTDAFTPAFVEAELRGLRGQAEADVRGDMYLAMKGMAELPYEQRIATAEQLSAGLQAAIDKRATQYLNQLRGAYSAKIPADLQARQGNAFDNLITGADAKLGAPKLAGLISGGGQLDPVDEVVLALAGKRADLEAVKAVLGGKSRTDVDRIAAGFQAKQPAGTSLRTVLFGRALTSDEELLADASSVIGQSGVGAALHAAASGKAHGHDRFLLQEMLDVPSDTGGEAQAQFLAEQSRKDAAWAVDDAGTMGKLHDWGGSEDRHLMDETADTAMGDLRIYRSYLAAGKTAEAEQVLNDLRKDRARMRLDQAAYSESVEKFRAQLASALSMAVDIAVMVFLPEAAPFLIGVGVTAAGHIAAHVLTYGDKYTPEMLQNDLLGAIGSAGASKIAGLALGGRAAVSGAKMADELVENLAITASRTIAKEASGLASESVLAMAKRQVVNLAKDAVEVTAGTAGGAALTGESINVKDVLTGMAMAKAGGGLRTARTGGRSGTRPPGGGDDRPASGSGEDAHTRPTRPYQIVDPTAGSGAGQHDGRSANPPTKGPTVIDDAPTAVRPRPARPGDADEHTDVDHVPNGTPIQTTNPHDPVEAWTEYSAGRTRDPHREMGMMWNEVLDQYAAVQGGPAGVDFNTAIARLGWNRGSVLVIRHSHPTRLATGATAPRNLVASPTDVRGICLDAARGGPERARLLEAIDVVVDRGPGRPPSDDRILMLRDRENGIWTIDYPLAGAAGGRGRVTFSRVRQFERWLGGYTNDGRTPASGGPRTTGGSRQSNEPRSPGPPPEALKRLAPPGMEFNRWVVWILGTGEHGAVERMNRSPEQLHAIPNLTVESATALREYFRGLVDTPIHQVAQARVALLDRIIEVLTTAPPPQPAAPASPSWWTRLKKRLSGGD